MNTTSNPGSFKPYKFKSIRNIASSALQKLKGGEVGAAFNFLIAEFINTLNKKRLLNKTGKYYCPLCNNHCDSFIHKSNAFRISFNSVCPHCTSRSRHRGLFFLYTKELENLGADRRILHFAPEPVFYSIFKNKPFTYQTTDYILEDVDFPKQDVQHLTISDNRYDLILINHVLEHVPNDLQGLSELHRISKPGGKVIISVPGNFSRKKTVHFKTLKHNGHYRDYGLDFLDKIRQVFADVELIDLQSFNTNLNLGIHKKEIAFVAKKR